MINGLRLALAVLLASLTLSVPAAAQDTINPDLFDGLEWRDIGPCRDGGGYDDSGYGATVTGCVLCIDGRHDCIRPGICNRIDDGCRACSVRDYIQDQG